jgi:hypothetical protein
MGKRIRTQVRGGKMYDIVKLVHNTAWAAVALVFVIASFQGVLVIYLDRCL